MRKTLKEKTFDWIFEAVIGLLLLGFAFFCLYPILYMLFASLSDPERLRLHAGALFGPVGFTLKGYEYVFQYQYIVSGFCNSFIIIFFGLISGLIMTLFAAYGLSHSDMLLHRPLMVFVVFTMFFSGGMIPYYLNVIGLGLKNSYLALLLPPLINAFNVIIVRSSILALPASISESARIDGANDFRILFKIVVPLIKPTLAVIALYIIVGFWNSWFPEMLFILDRDKYPLQLILREILINNSIRSEALMASNPQEVDNYKHLIKYCATIVSILPVTIVYPFLQKYFVKGILLGSLKG